MKQITILLMLGFFTTQATPRPEKIPSKLLELKAKSWYLDQVDSWTNYLTENPEDQSGWLELFKAAKFGGADREQLNAISNSIQTNFSETATALYVKSKVTGWNTEGNTILEQALSFADRTEFLEDRLILSEYKLSKDRADFSSQVFDAGLITKSTLNYGYNVLMSVSENGILFTDATHTTIPLWVLQDVMSVRKDVVIINLELSQDENYITRKLNANGLQIESREQLFSIPESNAEKDFFYALTLPRQNLKTVEDRLYVVGLASQYSSERLDHYNSLRENLEDKFLLDYLTIDFNGEPNTAQGKALQANYIVPFLMLKEYYDELDNSERSEFWKTKLLSIAEQSQLKTRVELLLNKNENERTNFKKTELDIKKLDKNMVQLRGNLYVSSIEVDNEDYWFYLDYLEQNGYDDLFEKSKMDINKYDDFTKSLLSNFYYSAVNYSAFKTKYMKKKRYFDYPAMDMSFEAAKAYCEWLTYQYNLQSDRKYKKVLFRLPSKKEWQIAALGHKDFTSWNLEENTVEAWDKWVDGKGTVKKKKELKKYALSETEVLYPWWQPNIMLRDKIKNQVDCYLANVKTPEEITCPAGIKGDGFTLMSPVGTYFPNQMGIYDVIGNVAEMINEEGKAMGGSWNHVPEESTIKSVNTYEGSDAAVGFRLFMEVIEE